MSLRWFKSILGPTFKLNADDIVVFMVGPSGGGKSWLIREVTGSKDLIRVGRTLKPSTKDVTAIRCELTDAAKAALQVQEQNHIVFVDTPSFLGEDIKAEEIMRRWLKNSKSKATLVGILYVDRIANYPYMKPAIQDELNLFALAFPPPHNDEFPCLPMRMRGILTYNPKESRIDPAEIGSRKVMFQKKLSEVQGCRFPGRPRSEWDISCHLECFEGDEMGEAWKAIVALFRPA